MLAPPSDRLTAMSPAKLRLRLFRFAQSLRCMWRDGDGEKGVRKEVLGVGYFYLLLLHWFLELRILKTHQFVFFPNRGVDVSFVRVV